jgi:hypothetical protein
VLWDYFILDTLPGTNNQYFSAIGDKFNQKQITSTKGYLNEYIFSMGGNYNDMLYIGATLGIPFFRYTQKTTYTESANGNFSGLEYYDEFNSRAAGVNLKFGILYQPVKFMRFGAGFHTPTLFPDVKETYIESFRVSNFSSGDSSFNNLTVPEFDGGFNYQLITPYHVTGNIAFLFDRYGFLNIDYEYVDYAISHMQSYSDDFSAANNNIIQYYQGTHTVRGGTEINFHPVAFRLGYSYTTNPYRKVDVNQDGEIDVDKDGSVHIIAAGIGYKARYFFMDFAYRYRILKDKSVFYTASNINPYSTELVNQQFALTLGWKLGK